MAPFPISVSVAVPVTIPVLVPIIPPRRTPIALPAASFYATPSPAVGASSPAISTISIATVISSTLITAAISKSSRHARAPTAAAAAALPLHRKLVAVQAQGLFQFGRKLLFKAIKV